MFGADSPKLAAAGLSEFNKYKLQKRVSQNPSQNAMVGRIASRLTQVIELPGARWEFIIFEDGTPNAFALPGGKVGIHTGLFKIAQNEAQLAAVVGHEIGHVVAGHAGERMSTKTLVTLGGAVLGAATQSSGNASAIGRAYGMGAQYGAILPFSRTHELEADKMGALYMARAGYDPRESISLWQNMASYKERTGGGGSPEFMSTHPVNERRIQELKEFMPRAMGEWRSM